MTQRSRRRNDRSRTRSTISRRATSRIGLDGRSRRHRLAEQLGERRRATGAKRVTRPGGARGVEHRLRRRRRRRARARRRAVLAARRRTPGSAAAQPRGAPVDLTRSAARRAGRAARRRARATSRPSRDDRRRRRRAARRARAGGWRRRTGTPARARSRSTSAQHVDADRVEAGERLVEDEQLGSWTSAAASCTRCWLPSDSFSTRSSRPLGDAEPLDPAVGRAARRRPRRARAAGRSRRAGRARASSGTGRAPRACSRTARAVGRVDRPALPADRAGVGRQHAEHDPHRGGLAGAVGADEAEHLAWRDGERQPVQGHHVAVAARQSVELEHPYIRSTILPSLPPARNRS